MFKKLILITLICFTPSAFAADWSLGEFFSTINTFTDDVSSFLFDDVPSLIDRMIAYIIEFITYIYIKMMIYGIQTSFRVAELILSDFGFTQAIEQYANLLPPDMRNAAVNMQIFNALNLIVEAYIARFVISFL